ncbi:MULTISPECIES: hypothetical protein [Chelativorans]|jgi:hypothetical protein|uniref:Uncharacterized protein n=1 Tax=Chelativorans sp. (strain BNC1) TaxID=266779 RepID=Q11GU3_CHESB|nr:MULTISPECIES: hypothetical protein [Chelativorans]
MQKNFLELKRQLAELSETINKFESEAVQLRIVELLFDQTGSTKLTLEESPQAYEPGPSRSRRAESTVKSRPAPRASRQRGEDTTPSASGAVAALGKLVGSDYFAKKRTIGDIVNQCQQEYGVQYKSNAFSGPLSRLAKKGVLKREKSSEGNYVYYK